MAHYTLGLLDGATQFPIFVNAAHCLRNLCARIYYFILKKHECQQCLLYTKKKICCGKNFRSRWHNKKKKKRENLCGACSFFFLIENKHASPYSCLIRNTPHSPISYDFLTLIIRANFDMDQYVFWYPEKTDYNTK